MSNGSDYRSHQDAIAVAICNLLYKLGPSTYNEIAPKVECWIEHGLTEQFKTIDDLVERVSPVVWNQRGSHSHISRFLKEFREAPRRPERMRTFVDKLCLYVLRWFGGASADDHGDLLSRSGGYRFIRTASFLGHLIQHGLLSRELVQRDLFEPLTIHHRNDRDEIAAKQAIRANAIYELFDVAGDTLLQGLLAPGDVQSYFKRLEARISLGEIPGLGIFSPAKLNEFREIHATWLRRKEEEERNATAVEVETPTASPPRELPAAHIDIDTPSSTLEDTEPVSVSRSVDSSPDTFVDVHLSAKSSPTLSISTISDLTPTETDGDTRESNGERIKAHHDTFYFNDGNVEIVCEDTVFRVHSTVISFASPNLRDILSPFTLFSTPMGEGCPRIIFRDTAEDFAMLLRMIYTPGFPARHKVPEFTMFAPLLRMATKYGFSDVREALVEDLKGPYPTSWEEFKTAKVLGEDVFGSPKPHPNAVLNLLLGQKIKFALPFAAYRAGLGGLSALTSNEPGAILPRLVLASVIHGMGEIRQMMARAAHGIVYGGDLSVCAERVCVLNAGVNPIDWRMGALKEVFDVLVDQSKGDMLSSPSLGNLVCASCAKALEDTHHCYRERFVWRALPSLLVAGGSRCL